MKLTAEDRVKDAVAFFREHASVGSARALAAAEAHAAAECWGAYWYVDPEIDSRAWSDEKHPYKAWVCELRDANGVEIGTLCGIDLGRDLQPNGGERMRVIEAELALDAMPQ